MYNIDTVYNDIDLLPNTSHLFTLSDASNIWSSDKFISMDYNKQKLMLNNSPPFSLQDRFARNRKPPGDRRDTNLIVNYLPDGFYEKELFDLFSQAGPIIHHHVVRNKDNRSECYGFVDFEKSSDADKAIDMFHQYPIQNKKLKVQNAAEGLLIKEEERHRAIKCITNIGYNVEVRNAPFRWTINDVKNVFGKYGELLKVTENEKDELENTKELKTKTFNLVYRYHTIAMKVVKKKNHTPAEALWPLELDLSIVGQEVIELPSDITRPRQRTHKQKFDQLSDSSWENKFENQSDAIYYQKSYENPINYWPDNSELQSVGVPMTSNGRPILKHKDNLMHLNNYESSVTSDLSEKWNSASLCDVSNSFFDNIRNDIKAIWAPKEIVTNDLIPLDVYVKTPLIPSRFRRDEKKRFKANVWYKMENLQPTGSFKLRGMAYWCYKAKMDGIHTVISSSGGNAGLAAAYASRLFKMKCVVFVPVTTPVNIITELLKENAEVIQEGSNWKEAHAKAENLCQITPRSKLAHPFDHPLLWSGYESIVDEIVADMKGTRIDMIVLSVGGGGLFNGIAQGITKNKLCKTTAILALETEGCACFNKSISANQIVPIVPNSLATSLGASSVSQRTWDIYCGQEFHLFSKTCSDIEAIDSCCQFLNEQNCLVEPACGAALSAVYSGTLDKMAEGRNSDLNVVVVVCGGRCVEVSSLLETRNTLSLLLNNTSINQPSSSSLSYNNNSNLVFNNNNNNHHHSSTSSSLADQFSATLDLNNHLTSSSTPPPLSNFSNLYNNGGQTPHRNYAAVVTDGKFPFARVNNNIINNNNNNNNNSGNYHHQYSTDSNNNFGDVPSPVGSQHSNKENQMLHH